MALAERLLRRTRPRPRTLQPSWRLESTSREPRREVPGYQLDVVELRATAMLVAAGAASRVTLANVRARPGLLWEAEQIAHDEGVEIVVLSSHDGGTIDLRVTSAQGAAGAEVADEERTGTEGG